MGVFSNSDGADFPDGLPNGKKSKENLGQNRSKEIDEMRELTRRGSCLLYSGHTYGVADMSRRLIFANYLIPFITNILLVAS